MGTEEENTTVQQGTAQTDPPKQREVNHTPAPQPESQQISPPVQRVRGDDILSAIESIPERVVAGIREATPKRPAQSAAPASKEPAAPVQQAQQQSTQAPDRKSFAEWWFGL